METAAQRPTHILGHARWRNALAVATICVFGFLAFWPALYGPWLLDDVKLQGAIAALNAQGIAALFNEEAGWQTYLFLGTSGIGRPLAMVSFAVNGLLTTEAFGFKLANLLLHLLNASLIYFWLQILLLRANMRSSHAALVALLVALAWAVHPIQVSTVAYVVQRMTILATLFALLALLTYTRLRLKEIDGRTQGTGLRSLIAWLLPLFLLPGLAILSKENGALIPVFLLLLEMTLFRFAGTGQTRRMLTLYFGAILVVGITLSAVLLFPIAPGFSGFPFGPGERLLTEARVLVMYLGQILLPQLGGMTFYYDLVHTFPRLVGTARYFDGNGPTGGPGGRCSWTD